MTDPILPNITPEIAATRKALAPDTEQAFREFGKRVFAEGAWLETHLTVSVAFMVG
jgi:hypothetical protein